MSQPVPLFPTAVELQELDWSDYPDLKAYLDTGPTWWLQHWHWGCNFLSYIGRNKSEHTYIRFRNDVERFLLWSFEFQQKPVDEFRKTDILDFIDFCVKPDVSWIADASRDRFVLENSFFKTNPDWRPFRVSRNKLMVDHTPNKNKYRPSQQTITSTFVGLAAFYRHLMDEEICYGNPVSIAKRDCKHLVKDSQVQSVKRLTDEQWQYVLQAAENLIAKDDIHERNLFIVAAMKTLFLRVSELSARQEWMPVMAHFWTDETENWWFKAYGKGKKIRDVTVPANFLIYLKRYRVWRGLSPLPYAGEQEVLVEKIRGRGGLTSRHITRLVQEVFDLAHDLMKSQRGSDAAQKLKQASTHYLRHTGASMEIERDRPLKDLSEDLGHASSATTDTVYVQVERKKRAESGKKRNVNL